MNRPCEIGTNRRGIALLLIPVAGLVAGCGAATQGAAATPRPSRIATPTAVTLQVSPLDGTWTTPFTISDVSPSGATFEPGTWTLQIVDGAGELLTPHNIVFARNGPPVFTGTNTMVLPADPNCPGQAQPTVGTFTFTITGNQLVFHEVSDSCVNRAFQLTAHPWTKG